MRRRKELRWAILSASTVIAMFAACDGGPTASAIKGFGVHVNLNGQQLNADTAVAKASNFAAGQYAITASSTLGPKYSFSINLVGIRGPGTYALGTDESIGGGSVFVRDSTTSHAWQTPYSGASGMIVISSLNDSHIAGEFSFTATPYIQRLAPLTISDAPGIVSARNGTFDLPLQTTGIIGAIDPRVGGSFVAKIGNTSFAAASGHATISNSQRLEIEAFNDEYQLLFLLNDIIGPGTYALSSTPFRKVSISRFIPPARDIVESWNTGNALGGGSVTISSITATRVMGTFIATGTAFPGSASQPLSLSGTFNVAIWPN